MPTEPVRLEHVWKKFRLGEHHDSLRDLIPATVRRLTRRDAPDLTRKDFWALQDVSFSIHKGDVLGIIGPNGAGKSTVLKLISGILRPTGGSITVSGRISALIEVGAGFHQDLTGRENIYLNAAILGMTKREIERQMESIVEFSGVRAFLDTPVKRYSSGMHARLGFAVAVHMNPDILLVDEVLSVGDALFRQKCIHRMAELMRRNVTVLLISHNIELVRQLCSRGLVLSGGRPIFLGPIDTAIDKYMHVLQEGGASYHNTEPLRHDLGKIHGLKIVEDAGRSVNQVACGDPVSLEIDYELFLPPTEVALAVGFSLPSGLWIANCNTANDRFVLGTRPGRHTLKLFIKSLHLAPADYDISIRMVAMEADTQTIIDHHHCRYKLLVNGEVQPGPIVVLDHSWT